MDLGIRNRVAVVTGASKGLGRAVAHALAAEGARIAIGSRTAGPLNDAAEEIRRATGADVLARPINVEDPNAIAAFVAATREHFAADIDILVNNAGSPPAGTAEHTPLHDWQKGYDRNFRSIVAFSQAVLPAMKRHKWGRIVNIASIAGKQPIPGLAVSNAMRAAVMAYAKTLSREVAADNVLVNTVCPGFTATESVNLWLDEATRHDQTTRERILHRMGVDIPMGRLGDADETARVVAFLCSQCASYITGTTLQIDGGDVRSLY